MIELNYITIHIILVFFIAIYYYLTRNFNYWSSRGINGPKPIIFIGTIWEMFRHSLPLFEEQSLAKYGNVYGMYLGTHPYIVVAEPQLIKDVMIRDFNVFVNRQTLRLGDTILDKMLVVASDEDWRRLRPVVSLTFTTGKMKKMHILVEQCVQALDKCLERVAKNQDEIEMKKHMLNYTMDVIASCAFATKTDTHNDPNNPFMKNAILLFTPQIWRILVYIGLKPLRNILRIPLVDSGSIKFFKNAITEIINKRRDEERGKYYDFLELMIQAQQSYNQEKAQENQEMVDNHTKTISFTDEDVLSNSFITLLAGFETTGNLLSYMAYHLAVNPECQQILLEELQKCIDENGDIDYHSLMKLPYLDAFVCETLRLNNPTLHHSRVASEDYKLGDTGITVPKGMTVIIPVHAIHHSPKYYPNPHRFDPNRFMPENRDKLIPYTYLPFGAGPRNCVGLRFALMEAKTAIARLITKYEFVRSNNTKVPVQFKKYSALLTPTDITIGVKLRNT